MSQKNIHDPIRQPYLAYLRSLHHNRFTFTWIGTSSIAAVMSGVCSGDQCLMHAAQLMQDSRSLSEYGVSHNSTIHLTVRLRGGAKGMQLNVKPRIQKDKWSNYWKVSSDPIHHRAQIQRALHTKTLVNLSQSFLAEALILSQVSSYFSASHLDNRVASSSEGRSRCCEHDPSVS